MRFLTIGAFARAARLTPKALRLYDELGLLRPVRVDEASGYRYYSPDQLERARLVAWLRRLGMPLAMIAQVCDARPAVAAQTVGAFLAVAEADLAERRGLARLLISYLSGRGDAMSASAAQLSIRYAAASDIGRERERNQDAAYAGARLLAVADGMGPGGDPASEAVIEALRPLESMESAGDLLNALSDAVSAATASLRQAARSDPEFAGSGSTLTAMVWSGSQLALVHIGDTRAYLLRDGGLFQITHDHSVVQSMIDAGRLTPEEASSHPQRSLLLRALAAIDAASPAAPADAGTADLSLHDAQPGDRYLLCSDGLTAVLPVAAIRRTLTEPGSQPADVVRRLIDLANEAGGPDNIACVVADVTQAAQDPPESVTALRLRHNGRMPTHVALLRGINVGGNNKVAMADLRAVIGGLGHTNVSTYINSGNVLFTPPPIQDSAAMAREMTEAIAADLGVSAAVVVVTRDELAAIVAANPFPEEPDHKRVHAVFLSAPAGPELLGKIDAAFAAAAARGARDSVRAAGRTLYLHTPDGFGTSEVSEATMKFVGTPKAGLAGVVGTARNWATVSKLLALCDG